MALPLTADVVDTYYYNYVWLMEVEVEALVSTVQVDEVVEVACRSDVDACRPIYLVRRSRVNGCASGDSINALRCIEVCVSECVLVRRSSLLRKPLSADRAVLKWVVVPARELIVRQLT